MDMSTFVKGAAVGVAAGCVTCMVTGGKTHKHLKSRTVQKKAQHAAKTIGGAMEELASIIK